MLNITVLLLCSINSCNSYNSFQSHDVIETSDDLKLYTVLHNVLFSVLNCFGDRCESKRHYKTKMHVQ